MNVLVCILPILFIITRNGLSLEDNSTRIVEENEIIGNDTRMHGRTVYNVTDEEYVLWKMIEARAAVSDPGEDYSANPDLIYLLQRSGVSDQDFTYFKKFIGQGMQALRLIGDQVNESRVGIDILMDEARNFMNFHTCCEEDRARIMLRLDRDMTLYNRTLLQEFPRADHSFVSPHRIDFIRPLQFIRGQYLKGGLARKKPTLLIIVFNFQTPYMSYRLLDAAVNEMRALKDAGAHVITLIVDRQHNRQPRLSATDLRERHSERSNGAPFSPEGDFDEEVEYFRDIFRRFQSHDQQVTAFDENNDDPNQWKIKSGRSFNDITALYAKAMSSKVEHGMKLRDFPELVSSTVLKLILGLITNPMSFFGDGELRASCEKTKNHIERTIWSPGFYTADEYVDHKECKWRLAAREGFRVALTFDEFDTEEGFDKVTVYDGYEEDEDQAIGVLSGHLTAGGKKKVTITSSEERISIVFKSDGGFRRSGFHAVWKPLKQTLKIDGATVVYLVDVSSSLVEDDFQPITKWIKTATKHFYFNGGIGYRSYGRRSSISGSKFGLVTFDINSNVAVHIAQPKNRLQLYQALGKMNRTLGETHIGAAMDNARTSQFLYVLGTQAFATPPRHPNDPPRKPPKRILFLFSDGDSVDDPRPAARRLCEWDIVPVFIATVKPDERTKEYLTSYCGLYFGIDEPVNETMHTIKVHLMLITNETTTPEPPVTPPGLPTKPQPPTRTSTTTTTTTPTPPTTWPPWTGTIPTIRTPTTTPTPPIPDLFDYFAIAVLLGTIGFVETITLLIMFCFEFCLNHPELPLESSISHELLNKKLEAREEPRPGEEEEKEEKEEPEQDTISKGSSDVSSTAKNLPKREEDIPKDPDGVPEELRDYRPTRYPETANSFFERSSFLPKHLDDINKRDKL